MRISWRCVIVPPACVLFDVGSRMRLMADLLLCSLGSKYFFEGLWWDPFEAKELKTKRGWFHHLLNQRVLKTTASEVFDILCVPTPRKQNAPFHSGMSPRFDVSHAYIYIFYRGVWIHPLKREVFSSRPQLFFSVLLSSVYDLVFLKPNIIKVLQQVRQFGPTINNYL